jgi:hypothetical protein
MHESSLHKDLKDLYTSPGDKQEVELDGYLIDVLHGKQVIEIQTANFSSLKSKLSALLPKYQVRIVYPIPQEKWLIKYPEHGEIPLSRRKSPKRGRLEDVFSQLVYIPKFLKSNNFILEVLLTRQEEIRRDDGLGSWRRKGVSIIDHRLVDVLKRSIYTTLNDYQGFFPMSLPDPFTTKNLSNLLRIRQRLAGKMIYTMRKIGLVAVTGKHGKAWLYSRLES